MLYKINNNLLQLEVNALGAEMQSLYSVKAGIELLWQADSQYWPRHAPILFPIVGKLKNNSLKLHQRSYPMSQHGFARDKTFDLVSHSNTTTNKHIRLKLRNSKDTLEQYPFEFELQIEYRLQGPSVICDFSVSNPSNISLPFSLGGHPAFNWPLIPGIPKAQHRIRFAEQECGTISQLENGLICRDDLPSPVENKLLALHHALFEHDALIFKGINSHRLHYEALQYKSVSASIDMQFTDFRDLGIWTKPGADFICLEPWLGYSSPVNFSGDFDKKPGLIHLPPRSSQNFSFTIQVKI